MGSNPIASSLRRRLKKARSALADLIDVVRWAIRCRRRDRYGHWVVEPHDDP